MITTNEAVGEYRPSDYSKDYLVGDNGEIISYKNPKPRTILPDIDKDGYEKVRLYESGSSKVFAVHALVAIAFLGPRPSSHHVVRHLDGNPRNNKISNLLWGTRTENEADKRRHGRLASGEDKPTARLTNKQADEMRQEFALNKTLPRLLSKKYNLSLSSVRRILNNESYI